MKNLIYFLTIVIMITSCNSLTDRHLQLNGPTALEAEKINKDTGVYIDGIYPVSMDTTSLSYSQDYAPQKTYYVSYLPSIVTKDFRDLRQDMDQMGNPVISIELNNDAHETWFKATEKAYQNKTPLFIVINGTVVSAPVVNNGPISGGKLQVSGFKSMDEVQKIITEIKNRYPEVKK